MELREKKDEVGFLGTAGAPMTAEKAGNDEARQEARDKRLRARRDEFRDLAREGLRVHCGAFGLTLQADAGVSSYSLVRRAGWREGLTSW